MQFYKKNIGKNILPVESSLRDVLKALNEGVFGIIFIADEDERIVGIFTDGDVRRSLLKGAELNSPVRDHMKKDFIYAKTGESKDIYLSLLTEKIRHLPILDDKKRLTDFISWAEMWRTPVMEPTLAGNELKYITDCITSNWISSQGSYVTNFEKKFAEYHGTEFALTTSNGTTALHLALVALGIGPGDEVIIPDLTFAACANTVLHTGAKPVFVDISGEHWTLDHKKIEQAITTKTRAIMPVHLYGHPCDMHPILEIAKQYDLHVIEDCAESLGARYRGKIVGCLGNIGCFSFFSNKVITTGEGGMVITKDRWLYEKMKLYRDHGMSKEKRYYHLVPGYNYRMTNLQAAIGLAQLEQIETFLCKRKNLANIYKRGLENIPGIALPPEMEWAESIFWLYSILIDTDVIGISKEVILKELERDGIETRPFFYPLHIQPPFLYESGDFPQSERISEQGVSLPSGIGLQPEEINRISEKIVSTIEHHTILNHAKKRERL